MWAAANGDLELVRALIKAGANVSLTNKLGTSALTEASLIGAGPVIDLLLKAGADPNTANPEGETPLMAVARSGKVDAAQRLLEAGADINARAFGGHTPDVGGVAGHADMVKLLGQNGPPFAAAASSANGNQSDHRSRPKNDKGALRRCSTARECCVDCARHLRPPAPIPPGAFRAHPSATMGCSTCLDVAAFLTRPGRRRQGGSTAARLCKARRHSPFRSNERRDG